jgi:hypothetical protein
VNYQPKVRSLPFSTILKNEPLTETNLEQLELNKGRQGGRKKGSVGSKTTYGT